MSHTHAHTTFFDRDIFGLPFDRGNCLAINSHSSVEIEAAFDFFMGILLLLLEASFFNRKVGHVRACKKISGELSCDYNVKCIINQ